MRAVLAALPSVLLEKINNEMYKVYVTDCLKAITDNTARYAGGNVMQKRYYDIIQHKKIDNRTGDEIVNDIIKGAGIKVVSKPESI